MARKWKITLKKDDWLKNPAYSHHENPPLLNSYGLFSVKECRLTVQLALLLEKLYLFEEKLLASVKDAGQTRATGETKKQEITIADSKAVDLQEKKLLKLKNKLYQTILGLTQQLLILFDIRQAVD